MGTGKPISKKLWEKLLSKEGAHNIEMVSKWIEFITDAILRTFTQSNFIFKCITCP